MTYIEQFQAEFTKRLESSEHSASILEWLSEKVLESYKNGIKAGFKRAAVNRKGKNRPNGSPTQAQ